MPCGKQRLSPLWVLWILVKSLIFGTFVLAPRLLFATSQPKTCKLRLCPNFVHPYSSVTPTVPQAIPPGIIGTASAIPGSVRIPSMSTAGQLEHLDVHRRALAAWRTVPHSTQLVWNRLAAEVEPHRPPFDHRAHISGQNLLVSAYHGFFTLGDEHLPEPQRFDSFPPFAIRLSDAIVGDTGVGVLSFACEDSTDGVFRVCFGIISLMNSVEQIRSTSGYPIMFPGPVPP